MRYRAAGRLADQTRVFCERPCPMPRRTRSPKRKKRGARKSSPASPQPPPTAGDDLAFWEARIAALVRRHPEEFPSDR